ncbi:helix-turn-helix domain-containing protein [Streptomyces sp. NPDC059720]|uniref:helix-turn-helix domain-containing protein n=1 Tax=Streptomyces sp. NPDC059720 TaxID=3346924 RepID=UPI0036CD5382
MSQDTGAAAFAALLGELKDRSGLSYGVLAKRLHMSTSTLHRYCNGDAVPADYAPVERLARLCKASPEELVTLHRRWVLADAGRGRKPAAGSARTGTPGPAAAAEPAGPAAPPGSPGSADSAGPAGPAALPGPAGPAAPAGTARPAAPTAPDEGLGAPAAGGGDGVPAEGAGVQAGAEPVRDVGEQSAGVTASLAPVPENGSGKPVRRRPRRAVLVGAAAAVALSGVGLAVAMPGGGADPDGHRSPAAASRDPGARTDAGGAASASPSAGPSPDGRKREKTDRAKESASAGPAASSPAPRADKPGRAAPGSGPAPLTVSTQPHAWLDPCSQRYLVNLPPERVVPPPLEQDAPGWVAAMGAVPSGEQLLKVTVQGTGKETVVVEALTVRTAGKRTPLAWNDYAMGYPGVGCGGGVPKRFFTVALDAARPSLVPEAGHADFPFTVSQSDPEAYYVKADASAYDVRWYLELTWSSGSRSGTLRVDDQGRPFRTSGHNGRPAYEFPLGGEKWVKAGTTDPS